MEINELKEIINKQRTFFNEGNTINIETRIKYLKDLRNTIIKYKQDIFDALMLDLGKNEDEAYMCEVGLVLSAISYQLKNIKKFSKPKRVKTPLFQFAAKSFRVASPYGNVLIMSPWNYPFLLSLEPLVEAISAGNTVLLKPSRYSNNTSLVMKKIINEVFISDYCEVVLGGHKENEMLINEKWDNVFFTGSKKVGSIVYENQSKYLTKVTLELGGKSPVIITKSANLKMAARRIAWGKRINSSQTCVAPDYIYIDESVHDEFIKLLKIEFDKQLPDPINNMNYCKMINEMHFNRVVNLINKDKVIYGGNSDSKKLKIEPTIIDNASWDDLCMKEEIFGPILPIIIYKDIKEAINKINSFDAPLAFYIYSNKKSEINYLINNIGFGGGCINDCIMHLATSSLGFGGFKESGMGEYHGKYGFDLFSHYKSIVDKKTFIDMPMRYNPGKKIYKKLINMFLK